MMNMDLTNRTFGQQTWVLSNAKQTMVFPRPKVRCSALEMKAQKDRKGISWGSMPSKTWECETQKTCLFRGHPKK